MYLACVTGRFARLPACLLAFNAACLPACLQRQRKGRVLAALGTVHAKKTGPFSPRGCALPCVIIAAYDDTQTGFLQLFCILFLWRR
jgi:hypothetical protein